MKTLNIKFKVLDKQGKDITKDRSFFMDPEGNLVEAYEVDYIHGNRLKNLRTEFTLEVE